MINAFDIKHKDNYQAINDDIIVSDMNFSERITSGGIILRNDNGRAEGIRSRWGKVYAIGPKQRDVSVGEWIFVEHGRWTRGFDIIDNEGEKTLRKVDPEKILLVWDDEGDPTTDNFGNAISENGI